MQYAHIMRMEWGLDINKFSDFNMRMIAEWFTDDVSSGVKSWREWILDDNPEAINISSNATWLEKDENIILFGAVTDLMQYDPVPDEYIVSMTKDNVLKLLEDWDRLYKLRFKELVITKENGIYRIEEVQ
jgi:hypothetical protein